MSSLSSWVTEEMTSNLEHSPEQKSSMSSDVKAQAQPRYRGLGLAFKSSGLRKGQAQALGQIYVKPWLGLGLGHGLADN